MITMDMLGKVRRMKMRDKLTITILANSLAKDSLQHSFYANTTTKEQDQVNEILLLMHLAN